MLIYEKAKEKIMNLILVVFFQINNEFKND